jgi:hypothetical protein
MRPLTVIAAAGLVLSPAAARVVCAQYHSQSVPPDGYGHARPVTPAPRFTSPYGYGNPYARPVVPAVPPGYGYRSNYGYGITRPRTPEIPKWPPATGTAGQPGLPSSTPAPPPVPGSSYQAPLGVNAITQAGSLPQTMATGMAGQPRLPYMPLGVNAITQAGSLPQTMATGMAGQPRLPYMTGDHLFGNNPAPLPTAPASNTAPAPQPLSELNAPNLGIYYQQMFYSNGTFGARLTRPPFYGTPAAQLQLGPGDTIFALNGTPFSTPADVLNHRAQTRVDFFSVRTNASQSATVNIPDN